MKTFRLRRRLATYGAVTSLVLCGGSIRQLPAQTFKTLHSFSGSDGEHPRAGLVLSSNSLLGTTASGGLGLGTVFAVNTDGTGFRTVYEFTQWSGFYFTNRDGVHPNAGLVLSGDTLCGTAQAGGGSANGTLFAVHTDGTGFTNLHSFTGWSGAAEPNGPLVLSGNMLYGTALAAGILLKGPLILMFAGLTILMLAIQDRDASWLWRGEYGGKVFNNTALVYASKGDATQGRNFLRSALSMPDAIKEPAKFSSRWVETRTFTRLQNVTIGYMVPTRYTSGRPTRLYVSGDNLALFSNYSGYDPEVYVASGLASRGIDYLVYPPSRRYTLGARIQF